jgi:hypothetical protein
VENISGLRRHERLTLPPYDALKPKGTIELSVDVTVGQLEMVRQLASGAASPRPQPKMCLPLRRRRCEKAASSENAEPPAKSNGTQAIMYGRSLP